MNSYIDLMKYFYLVNPSLKKDFKIEIDFGDFDTYLYSVKLLQDVDIEEMYIIQKETFAWFNYFSEMRHLLCYYKDQYENVAQIYSIILEIFNKERRFPNELMKLCKLEKKSLGEQIVIITEKEKESKEKAKNMKIFLGMIDSHISYLKLVSRKVKASLKIYNRRYYNVID